MHLLSSSARRSRSALHSAAYAEPSRIPQARRYRCRSTIHWSFSRIASVVMVCAFMAFPPFSRRAGQKNLTFHSFVQLLAGGSSLTGHFPQNSLYSARASASLLVVNSRARKPGMHFSFILFSSITAGGSSSRRVVNFPVLVCTDGAASGECKVSNTGFHPVKVKQAVFVRVFLADTVNPLDI